MKLQKRDLEIIKCCYEQQFLTIDQIEKFYFKSAHQNLARRRILKLRNTGLLMTEKSIVAGLSKIVRLTKTGQKLAESDAAFKVPQTRSIDIATLIHDSTVTSVRLRLAQLWDGAWICERVLKDRYKINPDGIVQFESGFNVAIEVENSIKGRTRFLELLTTWESVVSVSLILFVATTSQLERLILGYLNEHTAAIKNKGGVSQKLFSVISTNDLFSDNPKAASPAGALSIFSERVL